jgi:hypothetical protein
MSISWNGWNEFREIMEPYIKKAYQKEITFEEFDQILKQKMNELHAKYDSMDISKLEITDKSNCTLGIRLAKDDEMGIKYNPDYNENNIQIYISDPFVGLSVDITIEEATKLRNKLDTLINYLKS